MSRKAELLIPAGSLPVLKTAVRYGADAVYIGGEAFSLRAKAANFSHEEMQTAVRFAHERGVKVYVTANIFAHDRDLEEAAEYFRELQELRPDAVLISDPGMFALCRKYAPDLEIHISTQANTTNYESCLFWHSLGAKRIVLARELSLREIRDIRDHIPDDLELEAFVHGAMCISYSGRCLLSSYLAGRDANRGECTHPCRWKYTLMEETRPGEYMPVIENERGTYILNSKDLSMVSHLPDLYEAGINSLKVEGRMKTALYVATCARTYRLAMDALEKDPELYRADIPLYERMIADCTTRNFTTGFFYGRPDEHDQIYDSNTYVKGAVYLGTVDGFDADGYALVTQKNKFLKGDRILIMKPDGRDLETVVLGITDDEGTEMDSAPHPQQRLHLNLDILPEEGDVLKIHGGE